MINASLGPNVVPESVRLLPIFHFAEINGSNPNRRFDIYSDGELLLSDFSPSRFQVDSMHQNGRFLRNPNATFLLNNTGSSTLPPLINAYELYFLVRMDNLTTDADDGKINVYTACALHFCHVYVADSHDHHAVYSLLFSRKNLDMQ